MFLVILAQYGYQPAASLISHSQCPRSVDVGPGTRSEPFQSSFSYLT
jgi:hypothetical protein